MSEETSEEFNGTMTNREYEALAYWKDVEVRMEDRLLDGNHPPKVAVYIKKRLDEAKHSVQRLLSG